MRQIPAHIPIAVARTARAFDEIFPGWEENVLEDKMTTFDPDFSPAVYAMGPGWDSVKTTTQAYAEGLLYFDGDEAKIADGAWLSEVKTRRHATRRKASLVKANDAKAARRAAEQPVTATA